MPDLCEPEVEQVEHIVGMMGIEPMIEALAAGARVILRRRSSDAGIYAALPVRLGLPPGLAWHLGKIIECGAAVAEQRNGRFAPEASHPSHGLGGPPSTSSGARRRWRMPSWPWPAR